MYVPHGQNACCDKYQEAHKEVADVQSTQGLDFVLHGAISGFSMMSLLVGMAVLNVVMCLHVVTNPRKPLKEVANVYCDFVLQGATTTC